VETAHLGKSALLVVAFQAPVLQEILVAHLERVDATAFQECIQLVAVEVAYDTDLR
jgi:hypothetical protein